MVWRAIGVTLLWFTCCLPVVTAGPATIALLAVVRDDVLKQERPVVRSYVNYLVENLRIGLVIGVLAVGPVVAVFALDPSSGVLLVRALWWVALVGLVAAVPLLVHGFPLAAHTQQSLRTLYRDCVLLMAAGPGATVVGLAVLISVTLAAERWPGSLLLLGYPAARALFSGFRRTFDLLDRGPAREATHGAV